MFLHLMQPYFGKLGLELKLAREEEQCLHEGRVHAVTPAGWRQRLGDRQSQGSGGGPRLNGRHLCGRTPQLPRSRVSLSI